MMKKQRTHRDPGTDLPIEADVYL